MTEQDQVDGRPAAMLSGKITDDGWTVGERIFIHEGGSGGNFSVGYEVQHEDGRLGFLKALDFTRALLEDDVTKALQFLTTEYNFERDVMEICNGANLKQVVIALAHGALVCDGAPLGRVFYIIFELAEGDVNRQLSISSHLPPSWSLGTLHQISLGLEQLHSRGIYHQDLKPSNVLNFDNGATSKLADLGRAHCSALAAPHFAMVLPGDPKYAPPEQCYGFRLQDENIGKMAAEAYLLASMTLFLLGSEMLTTALMSRMRPEHLPGTQPGAWTGAYEDVLPYLMNSHADVVEVFQRHLENEIVGVGADAVIAKLVRIVRNLGNPDPLQRTLDKKTKTYNMRRAVSEFDLLKKRVRVLEK